MARLSQASLALLGFVFVCEGSVRAAESPTSAVDLAAVRSVVERTLPGWGDRFKFTLQSDSDRRDHFSVGTSGQDILVSGNSISALLSGAGWYLKYGAHHQISSNGSPIPGSIEFSEWTKPQTLRSSVQYRYALNQNTDGYTSPYWGWHQWEHELDVYALAGINTMLVERGTEAVIARTFAHFGYSDDEIRQTLAMPAHLNWQLMGNLCCFGGAPSQKLLHQRITSTQTLLVRMRALGMTPVLPGFYGMVPADFKKHFPKAHVIDQGTWNGFQRPAWLDPRDPLFPRIASAYYKAQHDLFGDTSIYDLELFQEGGQPGNVPLHPAVAQIETSLQIAHPGARWMILGWREQPAKEILEVVPHDKMFIVDLHQNAVRRPDRGADFLGAEYLYGGIWDYGGRTTLGGEAYDYGVRLPELPAQQRSMIGMAIFPEGMDNNPYLFDLFSEAAWHSTSIDLHAWTKQFAERRYGRADVHVENAWRELLETVYSKQAKLPGVKDEDDAAPIESLFNAQPSLTAENAFKGGSKIVYYDFSKLQRAMEELLQAPKIFDQSEAYRYDVVDVTRQVIANKARVLLPKIRAAYVEKDISRFEALTGLWLKLMDMQDQILGSDSFFRVGRWLNFASPWSNSVLEERQLSYDARSLLTSWGDRTVSENGKLHEYASKDWQGLTHDYYRVRWQRYFDSLDASFKTGNSAVRIDWYLMADSWNRATNYYSEAPEGGAREIANSIDIFLRNNQEAVPIR